MSACTPEGRWLAEAVRLVHVLDEHGGHPQHCGQPVCSLVERHLAHLVRRPLQVDSLAELATRAHLLDGHAEAIATCSDPVCSLARVADMHTGCLPYELDGDDSDADDEDGELPEDVAEILDEQLRDLAERTALRYRCERSLVSG